MQQNKNSSHRAISWFILALFVGCGNDAIVQYITPRIDPFSTAFYRLFLGLVILLPFMVWRGRKELVTSHLPLHLLRGVLTFTAIFLWISGVGKSSIVTASLVNFAMPIFSLLLAPWMLYEKGDKGVWGATIICFIGTCIMLSPAGFSINAYATYFIVSAICFALLDVLAKKYVAKDSVLTMFFYANLTATCCAAVPVYLYGSFVPVKAVWLPLLMLGIGGNLLLYCILQAYRHASLTSLAPLRYLELLIVLALNYLLFYKLPTKHELIGCLIILPTSFFIMKKRIFDS